MATEFAKRLIKAHEGLRLKPYSDSLGILTIGYGRNLEKGISQLEADNLFENDLIDAEAAVLDVFGREIFSIEEKRLAVLLDLAFNLGASRLKKFVKFIEAVKANDWQKAADELVDSLWFKQVGTRGPGNVNLLRQG